MLEEQTLAQSFFVMICSTILGTTSALSGLFDGGMKWFLFMLQIVLTIFAWAMSASLLHLCAELLGGTGSAKQLLKANGFIYFIHILVIPLYLIAYFLPSGGEAFTVIAGLTVVIWSAVLEVLALREVYGLSGAKAVLVLFLPLFLVLGVCIVAGIVGGIIGGSMIMSTASQMMLNPPEL